MLGITEQPIIKQKSKKTKVSKEKNTQDVRNEDEFILFGSASLVKKEKVIDNDHEMMTETESENEDNNVIDNK